MTSIIQAACHLKDFLTPGAERIEFAGSIRRGKPNPGDVEICAIPKVERNQQAALFGEAQDVTETNLLEALVAQLVAGDDWEFDPENRKNGLKYKRLRHRRIRNQAGDLVGCDLFIPSVRTWGIIFALRTGPDDFSKAVVSAALQRHWFVDEGLLHRHQRLYRQNKITGKNEPLHCSRGDQCSLVIPTPEESDFFAALGLPTWPPAERKLSRLMGELRRAKQTINR